MHDQNTGIDHNRQIAIIADDLTGAGDSGAQFARCGLPTRALLGEWLPSDTIGARVLVLDTDSRALSSLDAASAVRQAARSLSRAGITPIFKKIDSTLRGQPGAEIEALMDECGFTCAVLCPAFPENGRILAGGYLLVDGVPVSRGPAGKDSLSPVSVSHVPTLLAAQTRLPLDTCSLDDLDRGDLPAALNRAQNSGALLVCDAVSNADLYRIAEQALQTPGVLFAGAAGLAKALATVLAGQDPWSEEPSAAGHPVLIVVGSLHPQSRAQAQHALDSGAVPVMLTPSDAQHGCNPARIETLAVECIAALESGRPPLLLSPLPTPGIPAGPNAGAVAHTLAGVVRSVFDRHPGVAIVATGGDIARAILEKFHCTSLDIIGETAPGMPVCTLRGGLFPGTRIITKAGGFGQPDSLVHAATILAAQTINTFHREPYL